MRKNVNLRDNNASAVEKEENIQDTGDKTGPGGGCDKVVANDNHYLQIELTRNTAYEVCNPAQFSDEGVYYSYPNI